MSNDNKLTISLSLTNPPRRVPIELPSPTPSLTLHTLASNKTTIPLQSIRLIFRGKMIPSHEEGDVVQEFKLEDGCVVHCMGKPVVVSTANSAVAAAAAVSPVNGSAGSTVTPPSSSSSAAAASATTANSSNVSSNNEHPLRKALQSMKNNHSSSEYTTALNTISKLLSNIISHPMEEKYRKVKRSNAAFTKRLGRLSHSHEAMISIGFSSSVDNADEYALVPSADAWPKLSQCQTMIQEEINSNRQQQQPRQGLAGAGLGLPTTAPDLGFGAMPPMGNNSFPSMPMPAQASQMMDSVLSNPAALQSMLSNPMIQNMIMNDPRMSNNPMMQNSMRDMMNNPQMVQQVSRMMNDPNVRSRMNAMMQQSGGAFGSAQNNNSGTSTPGGGGNGGMDMAAQMEMMRQFSNMASSTNAGNVQQQQQQPPQQTSQSQNQASNNSSNPGSGDRDMTEEEMIAEAIARSMREQ